MVKATVFIPARIAASIPWGLSSKTTQFLGVIDKIFAAFKNTSGSGLPLDTSSEHAAPKNIAINHAVLSLVLHFFAQ